MTRYEWTAYGASQRAEKQVTACMVLASDPRHEDIRAMYDAYIYMIATTTHPL